MTPAMIACEDIASHPDFCTLRSLVGVHIDLRYASTNNFLSRNFYGALDCAYLRREAAGGLTAAAQWVDAHCPGHRIRVLDALRPQSVQEQLYRELEGTPLARYLAHPTQGSIHSFGMAVDVTLIDVRGEELDMGSGFDEMTPASHTDCEDVLVAQGQLQDQHLRHRAWLRHAMQHGGFHGISTEWWHFDFGDRAAVRRDLPRVR
jgi:D-alanyl-D-alanine dipeptidase